MEGVVLSEATVVTLVVAVIVMALATAEQGVVEGSLDRERERRSSPDGHSRVTSNY